MENSLQIEVKKAILGSFKESDPETHSKIMRLKELIQIEEVTGGRYSVSFLLDLYFAFENGLLNIDAVMHEVRFLEGMEITSRTKKETQFKHPPLKGLWHKHYFDGSIPMLAQNVKVALDNYGIPYFEKMINEAKESGEERFVTIEDIPNIVNDVITSNLQRRRINQKVTGEWLIYAIYEGKKYYLCLSRHEDQDDEIRGKIDSLCLYEFPFLKNILP